MILNCFENIHVEFEILKVVHKQDLSKIFKFIFICRKSKDIYDENIHDRNKSFFVAIVTREDFKIQLKTICICLQFTNHSRSI